LAQRWLQLEVSGLLAVLFRRLQASYGFFAAGCPGLDDDEATELRRDGSPTNDQQIN
jgi:hypothetical protein